MMLYVFDELNTLCDSFFEDVMPLLSQERYTKVSRLRCGADKNASAAAYLLLRLVLLDTYNINETVSFVYEKKGKPVLESYPDIHFNLSHCKNAVACAVSDEAVGVDIQHITPISDKVARRVMTDCEYAAFKASSAADDYFCEIWTVKESFLKCTGQGIASELRVLAADEIMDKNIIKGNNYFCCVCGHGAQNMHRKHIRREHFGKL